MSLIFESRADCRSVRVVVVGGGPAGSSLAIALASRPRFEVILVDAGVFPRAKPCGDYLNPVSSRLLKSNHLLGDSLSELGHRLSGLTLHSPGMHHIRAEFGDRSPAYGACRSEIDRAMLDVARRSSVKVREGTRFLEALRSDGHVVGARVETPRGKESLPCDLLIGADGIHSGVARSLNLHVRGTGRVALVGRIQVREEVREASMLLGRFADLGLCPISPRVVSAGFLIQPSALRHVRGNARVRFFKLCEQFPQLPELLPGLELSGAPTGWGRFRVRSRGPGVKGAALVGDALGFDDPLPGNGVEMALRSASLLASAIDGYGALDLTAYSAKLREELGWRRFSSRLLFQLTRSPVINDVALRVLGSLEPAGEALIRGFQGIPMR